DLIGIKVYDENDNFIGVVDDIDETSPQDKFVIKTDSKTFMLPSVKEFILSLDVENKKMTVHLIDGILDL
ncbi:MAG: PRC-barrel domain-containing protein, partial [Clostridia bacterium]|nr:PRC-barrel domain-containing protein [Clostridia bacterium]